MCILYVGQRGEYTRNARAIYIALKLRTVGKMRHKYKLNNKRINEVAFGRREQGGQVSFKEERGSSKVMLKRTW